MDNTRTARAKKIAQINKHIERYVIERRTTTDTGHIELINDILSNLYEIKYQLLRYDIRH